MLRWISIRWANHVIDFHPVTFSSGICDVQTALLLPVFFCRLVSTPPHVHALYYNHGNKYDLCNPFRPHEPLLIVISLNYAVHGARWTPGHYRVAITAITIKSDMRTNYIFVQSKWLSDLQWLLPDQPFLSRKRKRLHAPLALGNLNNSLRCADAIGPATCVCAVYLTVCTEEIRTWIADKRYLREAWGAEQRGATRGQLPAQEWQLLPRRCGRLAR